MKVIPIIIGVLESLALLFIIALGWLFIIIKTVGVTTILCSLAWILATITVACCISMIWYMIIEDI